MKHPVLLFQFVLNVFLFCYVSCLGLPWALDVLAPIADAEFVVPGSAGATDAIVNSSPRAADVTLTVKRMTLVSVLPAVVSGPLEEGEVSKRKLYETWLFTSLMAKFAV